MRMIGNLKEETHANRFAAYLVTKGIQTQLDPSDGSFEIWVRDEDKVGDAIKELDEFQKNPNDGTYRAAEAEAVLIQKKERKKAEEAKSNIVDASQNWNRFGVKRKQPLTIALSVICVILFLWANLSEQSETYVFSRLAFLDTTSSANFAQKDSLRFRFRDVRKGEIWRVFTPAVMHVDILHIAMNLIGFVYLGGQIESHRGTWRFGLLVIFVAVFSNVLQGCFGGINFLGISGVVYGAFGYLWMKTIFEPESGMFISEFLIILGVAWILAGIFGITAMFGMGNMANWAHVGGLVAGVVVAMLPTFFKNLKKPKRL